MLYTAAKHARQSFIILCLTALLYPALPTSIVFAGDAPDLLEQTRRLDDRTQALKKDVMELGRKLAYLAWVGGVRPQSNMHQRSIVLSSDMLKAGQTLARLEDGLLTPPGIQLVVFVSLSAPKNFNLQQLQLKLGREVVQERNYSDQEVSALQQGGVHRLYVGNIPEGRTLINVNLKANKGNKDYFDRQSYIFTKEQDRKTIEINVAAGFGKPKIRFKEWD